MDAYSLAKRKEREASDTPEPSDASTEHREKRNRRESSKTLEPLRDGWKGNEPILNHPQINALTRRHVPFDFTQHYQKDHMSQHVGPSIDDVSVRQELYSKIKDQMEGEFLRDKEHAYTKYWKARLRKQERAEMQRDLEDENDKVLKAERVELRATLREDVEEEMRPYLSEKIREEEGKALKEKAFEIVRKELSVLERAAIRKDVEDELRPAITASVGANERAVMKEEIKGELLPTLEREFHREKEATLREEIVAELQPAMLDEVRRTAKEELKREIKQDLIDELTPKITQEVRVRKTKALEKAWGVERDKQRQTADRMARLDEQIFNNGI